MTSIQKDVIENPGSLDGQALASRLDEAITSGSLDELRPLWEYIKARQVRLRTDLSSAELQELTSFIEDQRSKGRFILSQGALEAYLPTGYKGKDLEKVIRLASQSDLWELLPETKDELEQLVHEIQPSIK
jgi:SpoVK/Ycf46/Vps4 family AAA+-type ATPase